MTTEQKAQYIPSPFLVQKGGETLANRCCRKAVGLGGTEEGSLAGG